VTPGALLGLLALNLLYLAAGALVLWAARGWKTWSELWRLAGVAYVVGVAASGTLWSLTLVAGIPLSLGVLLGSFAAVVACGLAAGLLLGRTRPAPPATRVTRDALVGAIGLGATAILLAALFRAARLSGLYAWDAWSFWVPKAKAIYFTGGLDERFLGTVPHGSYPPLLPILDAAAFRFMGAPDVVTLHVQFWFFAAGFVFAAAGLLSERVPAWILWPSLLLVLVAPRVGDRLLTPQADFLLDYFVVAAAVLVVYWLDDGRRWRLASAALLLAAAGLTKREGLMLAACLLVAAFVASFPRRRVRWPGLVAAGAVVALATIPWRVWYSVHGVGSELPPAGVAGGLEGGRLGSSLRLALDVLFDVGLWSLVVPLGLLALVLAILARAGTPAVFTALLLILIMLGGAWVTWVFPELPITAEESANPIVRYTQAPVLLLAALTPILLGAAWRRAREAA
jgi:hypothetical protein